MPVIKVPPTSLRYDDDWSPDIRDTAHAQRLFDYAQQDPIVVHQDEVLAEEEAVVAAVYLGISEIEVLYVDSEDAYLPEEALENAGPSNDA